VRAIAALVERVRRAPEEARVISNLDGPARYNEERSLRTCSSASVALAPELEPAERKLRVLVVDDGSTDGTIAAAERFREGSSSR